MSALHPLQRVVGRPHEDVRSTWPAAVRSLPVRSDVSNGPMGTTTLRTTDDTTAPECFLVRHTRLAAHASFDLTSATPFGLRPSHLSPGDGASWAADVACPFGLGALVHAV